MNPYIIPGLKHFYHEKTGNGKYGPQRKGGNFQLIKDVMFLLKEAELEIKHFQGKQLHEILDRKRFVIILLTKHFKSDEVAIILETSPNLSKMKIEVQGKMRRSQKLRNQFEDLKTKYNLWRQQHNLPI